MQLTKIEQLDQQFPGLADDVRGWLMRGISTEKMPELIFEKYQIFVPRSPLARFRCRRWVPEQERLQAKRIAILAAQEVAREQAFRASLARERVGGIK